MCANPTGIGISEGEAAEAIVAEAREVGADLIVMETRGRNPLPERILGPLAKQVLGLPTIR